MVRTEPYSEQIDFKDLASKDYRLGNLQSYDGYTDFTDPRVYQAVTKAVLRVDFGLEIELPYDRLCPPIPNRFNYVVWIQALLDQTGPNYGDEADANREIVGLDIGTGASAIYALLILASRPNWRMCLTDIDKKSFNYAGRNLALNNLLSRSTLLQTTNIPSLIPLHGLGVEKLDFTICNPPFFTSEEDMHKSMQGEGKVYRPHAGCSGTPTEMVCPGGDLGFVTQIIDESLVLRERVRWYSSMLGKLESAHKVITILRGHGIENYAVGVIDTGGRTKRWIVAWSFGVYRPRNDIARPDRFAHEYLPYPTLYKIPLAPTQDPETVTNTISTQLSSLDLTFDTSTGVGETPRDVWSRKYRFLKRKAHEAGEKLMMTGDVVLAFRVQVKEEPKEVTIDWLRGSDRHIWESFCGFLHRVTREVNWF
ncbi:uncharacterized protein BDR25DRAFT_258325 [Lindgomyces ingoldianus]|uniref:Uncharacterized protein n=1 Tax=Lindgomyces ingoldianus TaxID=673940 RepID=A0ACB6R0T7_9PLEO|nr:uncharacterized protein BDR25DRAFT_258325 [Lindgomyces ingoldianus]KAF2472858.1 hypothetical protein BDR25DRAFT_258325 [Lindgomyces ingoldianus]